MRCVHEDGRCCEICHLIQNRCGNCPSEPTMGWKQSPNSMRFYSEAESKVLLEISKLP